MGAELSLKVTKEGNMETWKTKTEIFSLLIHLLTSNVDFVLLLIKLASTAHSIRDKVDIFVGDRLDLLSHSEDEAS